MNNSRSLMKSASVFAIALILSACGSAPTIRDSKRIDSTSVKPEQISFVYRQSVMKTVSSYGRGSASDEETGFLNFGKLLTKQAPDILSSYGISVTSSRLIDNKDSNDTHGQDVTGETPAGHVLHLSAVSGRVSATIHATSISHIFSARLLDARSGKPLWMATIDTSTWSGRDFIQKNFQKTLYDEAYAKQLLQVIADRMKEDGVI